MSIPYPTPGVHMDVCTTIRRNLYCSYMLEQMVANLFTAYIDSIDGSNNGLGVAKIVLSVLAIESKNHATYIDLMARHYNLFDEAECTQLIGRPWTLMQELLSELSEGRKMNLKEFIEKQAWIERAVGEETYHKLLLPLINEGVGMGCIDKINASVIESILSKIASDEVWHEKLLQLLLNIVSN